MPVEDIDYLYEHGIKENKVLFIDSASRDKTAYPTPSEYVVNFHEPFTNVYGLDIIDASVPRTMYNVDVHKNKLVLGIGTRAKDLLFTVNLSTRDYNVDQMVGELTSQMTNLQDPVDGIRYSIQATKAGEGKSELVFTSSSPFVFDMKNSTIADVIGFDLLSRSDQPTLYTKITNEENNEQLYGSVSNTTSTTTLSDPFGNNYILSFVNTTIPSNLAMVSNVQAIQRFVNTEEKYLGKVTVQVIERGAFSATNTQLQFKIVAHNTITDEPTNTIIKSGSFSGALNASNQLTADFSGSSVLLSQDTVYWLYIFSTTTNTNPVNALGLFYNSPASLTSGFVAYTSNDSGATRTPLTNNQQFNLSLTYVDKTFTITSPFGVSYSLSQLANSSSYSPISTSNQVLQRFYVPTAKFFGGFTFQVKELGTFVRASAQVNYSLYAHDPTNNRPLGSPLSSGTVTTFDTATSTYSVIIPGTVNIDLSRESYYWIVLTETTANNTNDTLVVMNNNPSQADPEYLAYISSDGGVSLAQLQPIGSQHNLSLILLDKTFSLSVPFGNTQTNLPKFKVVNKNSVVIQKIYSTSQRYLSSIKVQAVALGGFDPTTAQMKFRVYKNNILTNEPGELLVEGDLDFYLNLTGTYSNSTLADDDFVLYQLQSEQFYWLYVWEDTSTSNDVAMAVLFNTPNDGNTGYNAFYSTDSGATRSSIGTSNQYCMSIDLADKSFTITSPGMVSLVGERFIIMRCPEIENYVYGSAAYGYNAPGLALFKLGVVGYSDTRFDFSSFSFKEFHPIGKLSKITLRFERVSGELYDFKGINHHLLVVVRYLVMRPKSRNKPSSLNPSYNPNFMQYLRYMEEKETDELEDDDEENVDDQRFRNVYLKREQEYIQNSRYLEEDEDDDEEDDEDDDEEDVSDA
jgi:hypothetical protein